jgi:DMSO/TMAO reductase YedYZ molybdopterin-dependent catalytic subunit
MPLPVLLTVSGLVDRPLQLSAADLAAIGEQYQVPDVGLLEPGRRGRAVRLEGLLAAACAQPAAQWITVHARADDFHASVPLAAIRARAVLIYELAGGPLPVSAGGPLRLLIPDFAACRAAEVDECANVKFVDALELSADRGHDNRPADEAAHARLHAAD